MWRGVCVSEIFDKDPRDDDDADSRDLFYVSLVLLYAYFPAWQAMRMQLH